MQLHLVKAGAKFTELSQTMAPIIQNLLAACLYPVTTDSGLAIALDPMVALGDEQMLQLWSAISNSTEKCCSSCNMSHSDFHKDAIGAPRALVGENCKRFTCSKCRHTSPKCKHDGVAALLGQKKALSAADRNKNAGCDRRPLWMCYELEIVEVSVLDTEGAGLHFPAGFVYNPDQVGHMFFVPPLWEDTLHLTVVPCRCSTGYLLLVIQHACVLA